MKPLLTAIFILTIFFAPDLAWAQPDVTADGLYTGAGLIPCGQSAANPCNSCHVVILANTIIKWVIGITFMLFAGIAVYSGVKMVISGGNSGALSDAKEMFTNAFIGLLIILGAWLMIDTLLRFVLQGGENGNIEGYGPWSQVECTRMAVPETIEMTIQEEEFSPSFYSSDSAIPIVSGAGSGPIQQRILSATLEYRGSSTSAGPGSGNTACAWAINNILRNAGIAAIGDSSVKNVERALVQGRGVRVSQSDAVGGDLVLLIGASAGGRTGNHIGVCLNQGCTRVLSNSSSRKSFVWESGPTFTPSYSGGSPRFFRVQN